MKGSSKPHASKGATTLSIVNGRLVGPSFADPAVKRKLAMLKKVQRADKSKLRDSYIKMGLLTPGGKLTKAYGG